ARTYLEIKKKLLFVAGGFDDLGEAAGIEAGATNECTVDVRLGHQIARVVRFHAAAVLNPNLVGRRFVGHFAQRMTNERVRFLRLLRGRVTPGSDRPDRFVGDYRFVKFFFAQILQAPPELDRQYLFDTAFLALLQSFADANNRAQGRFVRGADFAVHDFVG